MQEIVFSCIVALIELRYCFWELNKSEPLWLRFGLRWCFSWISNRSVVLGGEDDVDN